MVKSVAHRPQVVWSPLAATYWFVVPAMIGGADVGPTTRPGTATSWPGLSGTGE